MLEKQPYKVIINGDVINVNGLEIVIKDECNIVIKKRNNSIDIEFNPINHNSQYDFWKDSFNYK